MKWAENAESWIAECLNLIEHIFKFNSYTDCICSQLFSESGKVHSGAPPARLSAAGTSLSCPPKAHVTPDIPWRFPAELMNTWPSFCVLHHKQKGIGVLGGGTAAPCRWDYSQMPQSGKGHGLWSQRVSMQRSSISWYFWLVSSS